MKIRKKGKTVNLTEEEVKKIINRNKINNFLSEDKESRKTEDKKVKVTSILNKLTTVSNMLRNIPTNLESLSTLNKIEEFLEKIIEDMEDKLENKKEPKTSLKEGKGDDSQYHRKRDGSNPGIEDILKNTCCFNLLTKEEQRKSRQIQDRLEQQLNTDVYSNVNNPTNLGKGTRKMVIFLNNKKFTIDGFIDQVQRDGEDGYCHTIKEYEYNNRLVGNTVIKITTDIVECNDSPTKQKRKQRPGPITGKPKCEIDISPKNIPKENIVDFQEWCLTEKRPGTTIPCYVMNRNEKKYNEVDGIWECETQKCWHYCVPGRR